MQSARCLQIYNSEKDLKINRVHDVCAINSLKCQIGWLWWHETTSSVKHVRLKTESTEARLFFWIEINLESTLDWYLHVLHHRFEFDVSQYLRRGFWLNKLTRQAQVTEWLTWEVPAQRFQIKLKITFFHTMRCYNRFFIDFWTDLTKRRSPCVCSAGSLLALFSDF